MVVLRDPIEFQWDKGNIGKNQSKHSVGENEAEEPFFDKKRKTFRDHLHSRNEERFRLIGKTKNKRLLFIIFTIRSGRVRVISARDINKREVRLYEEKVSSTKV